MIGSVSIKVLAMQTQWPEFHSQNPQKGGQKEPTWSGCSHGLCVPNTHHAHSQSEELENQKMAVECSADLMSVLPLWYFVTIDKILSLGEIRKNV